MKNLKNKAFTLVELLVVITILAIMSVVAYQSFGGATDKAQNSVKLSNLTILTQKLQEFQTSNNYYPMPQDKSDTNRWGYDKNKEANPSNYIKVEYNQAEINSLTGALADYKGGGIIYGTGTWKKNLPGEKQIGAKGVLGIQGQFNKKYIKKTIYDTQLGDIKLTGEDKKMIDYGIGKFVYAVYSRASGTGSWNVSGTNGVYFELATTLKNEDKEGYTTKIEGDYSNDNFSGADKDKYPETLIGLTNGESDNPSKKTTDINQGIPYALTNFAK